MVQSSGVNVNGLAFVNMNITTEGQSVNSLFHWVGWEIYGIVQQFIVVELIRRQFRM